MNGLDWNLPEDLPPPPGAEQEIRRANESLALLNSAAWQRNIEQMRENVLANFRECSIADREALLYCKLLLKVIDDFEKLLTDEVSTGKMAALQTESVEAFKGTLPE